MSDPISKMERLKAIRHGKGIQYILDRTSEIMGNPALIFDMDYKLIASSDGAVNDDPIWGEFMAYGRLSDETIEFFKNESFIDSVANCTQFNGVTYLFSDKLKHDRIFGQLYNKKHLPVADLIMMACNTPFEEDTPGLIKTVCDVLSKELRQSEYYQDYGQSYQENIVKKLIEGTIDDKVIYAGHVSNIDKGLKANIFIAVADFSQCSLANNKLVYFRDLFSRLQRTYKYYIYADYIIILISSNSAELSVKRSLNKLNKLFVQENIYAGISSRFENLFELPTYYKEAVRELNYGLHSDRPQRFFLA